MPLAYEYINPTHKKDSIGPAAGEAEGSARRGRPAAEMVHLGWKT